MNSTVTTRTLDVFTAANGASMTFTETTVLVVRMGTAQLRTWNWLQDENLQHPMSGHEIRDTTGALLGVVLSIGWLTGYLHVEWFDPETGEFYAAGECDQAITQGIARILEERTRNVGPVPAGEGFAPAPVRRTRNKACPFLYCFDPHCIDHGPVWADTRDLVA